MQTAFLIATILGALSVAVGAVYTVVALRRAPDGVETPEGLLLTPAGGETHAPQAPGRYPQAFGHAA